MTKSLLLNQPQVIFLMGPTASGKTKLAMTLRQYLPVEIISVDSALVYRDMNIGTSKPNTNDLLQAPHRLIDICDPAEIYSVANFRRDALKNIVEIINSGRIPLLVGGTMFYFKKLLEGLSPLPQTTPEMRASIERSAKIIGWHALHKQLQEIDPTSANRIYPNDFQRISRALEVFFISGKTLSESIKEPNEEFMYKVYQFAIAPVSRYLLHQRIKHRFYQMLANGFEHEVNALFSRKDLCISMPSIRCVGYRQMWAYLSGKIDYNEMIFQGICATQQLAKRQMTWLRKWKDINWLNSDELVPSIKKILHVISR